MAPRTASGPAPGVIPFLVAMMLLTGVCNTLLSKYQDQQCVRHCSDPDPKRHVLFEQPVVQTLQMFVGESGCWLVVWALNAWQRWKQRRGGAGAYQPVSASDTNVSEDAGNEADNEGDGASIRSTTALIGNTNAAASAEVNAAFNPHKQHDGAALAGWRVLLLSLPAICDILGTTLMNAGLLLVAASIYQMTRGALVLFVGLFSVIFLRRRLLAFQWLSLVGVVAGVAVVGLAGAIQPDPKLPAAPTAVVLSSSSSPAAAGGGAPDQPKDLGELGDTVRVVAGVLMIAGAQVFTATQFVLEEWVLERSSMEPIRVVGWEGVFGFVVTLVGMAALHLTVGRADAGRGGPFDLAEGWRQFWANRAVFWSSLAIMASIGGFNFFGLSVTRSVSATSRSTIDTCRTLFIWIASLALGWETFKWLQIAGFALLVYFTFLFNGIVRPPLAFLEAKDDIEELLPEEPIEHS